MFAGTQVDLLRFGFALGQAATEMFVQPGAAVFFAHDFAVHPLRLRQPVVGRGLDSGRQQQNRQKQDKAACGHGGGNLLKWKMAGYLKVAEGAIENSYGEKLLW